MPVTFDDIRDAQALLKGNAVRTPFLAAPKLSDLTGANVYVKMENLQVTSSFKDRGAYVKLASLDDGERRRGVVTMSAGNHAQAVAYHAGRLGIPATIVMPETTPFTKVERTRGHGATVVLSGETLADSQVTAEALMAEKDLVLVHPYDDDRIIAGQGTIGLEMLEDEPGIETIVVPVGGGGVISGIAIAAKHLKPGIEVVGVEARLYPSMSAALQGEPAKCGGQTLAEGIAVKNVTERTVSICRRLVDGVRLVGETDIERAVMAYLAHARRWPRGQERPGWRCCSPSRSVSATARSASFSAAATWPRASWPRSSTGNWNAKSASWCCASRSRTAPACSARSPRCSAPTGPISSRCRTSACSSTFPPRAPSSRSCWRPATGAMPTRSSSCWRRKAS
jgi:threonine dehydratase